VGQVDCPQGTKVLGGSASLFSNLEDIQASMIYSSNPKPDGTGWEAEALVNKNTVLNPSLPSNIQLSIDILCGSVSP
jgi:hypothetical protein